jgi:hypothetical protein
MDDNKHNINFVNTSGFYEHVNQLIGEIALSLQGKPDIQQLWQNLLLFHNMVGGMIKDPKFNKEIENDLVKVQAMINDIRRTSPGQHGRMWRFKTDNEALPLLFTVHKKLMNKLHDIGFFVRMTTRIDKVAEMLKQLGLKNDQS